MIIIFEGLDRVGKTTQINKVREFLNPIIFINFHLSNLKINVNIEEYSKKYYKEFFELLKETSSKYNFLFDRFHLGEYVYSPIYRNYSGEYVFELEKLISNSKDVFLFLFIDNIDNLEKREDGKSLGNFKEKEIQLFKEAFEKSSIKNKIIIDIKDKNENDVTTIIKDFINNNISIKI